MSKPESANLTCLLGAGAKIQVMPNKVVSLSWQTFTFRITLGAGRFVTFFGYEWAGEGHTNVYFMDPDRAQVFHGPRIQDHPRDKPVFQSQPENIAGHTGSQSCPKKCGLQATFAPRLGRSELFAAMQQRLTYGTTGARIIMILKINGALMGNEIRVPPRSRLDVTISIGGTAPLNEISLHRYDGQKWSCPLLKTGPGGPTWDIRQQLPAGRGVSVYYLRARQQDGEMAWSSPIWVATAL